MDTEELRLYHEELSVCPACDAGADGTLDSTGEGGGYVIVTCDACGHRWRECEPE